MGGWAVQKATAPDYLKKVSRCTQIVKKGEKEE